MQAQTNLILCPTRSLTARTRSGYIACTMQHPNRLAELRKKAGLSQDALAEALGTGRSTVVKLEKGERELSIEWMERIAPKLNCKPWHLLPAEMTAEQREMAIRMRYRAMDDTQRAILEAMATQMDPQGKE